MSLQAYARYPKIAMYARKSRELGKLAETQKGSRASNILQTKIAVDATLVAETEKLGGKLLQSFMGSNLAKGLTGGSVLAGGTLLGANELAKNRIDQVAKAKEDVMTNMLRKGTMAAGALGLGALGLTQVNKMMDSGRRQRMMSTSREGNLQHFDDMRDVDRRHDLLDRASVHKLEDALHKRGSDENAAVEMAEKIAAAGDALGALRSVIDSPGTDDSVRKLAEYSVTVANAHIADMVGDLIL